MDINHNKILNCNEHLCAESKSKHKGPLEYLLYILRLINTILFHASSSYMSIFVNLTLC